MTKKLDLADFDAMDIVYKGLAKYADEFIKNNNIPNLQRKRPMTTVLYDTLEFIGGSHEERYIKINLPYDGSGLVAKVSIGLNIDRFVDLGKDLPYSQMTLKQGVDDDRSYHASFRKANPGAVEGPVYFSQEEVQLGTVYLCPTETKQELEQLIESMLRLHLPSS